MLRCHRQRLFLRNLSSFRIILPDVGLSFLIRRGCERIRPIFLLAAALVLLASCGRAQVTSNVFPDDSSRVPRPAAPVAGTSTPSETIVIGFLGGFVRHDDAVHSEVQLAQRLHGEYPTGVHVEAFENRRLDDAHKRILSLLAPDGSSRPTNEEKRAARVILYGHSWGANAVVALARQLEADGIPVRLTIQVDSIAKDGQNDGVIPSNVAQAVNFYQDKGFLHGQPQIRAADASRTQILGNFRMDYAAKPVSCPQYPWYGRVFMRSHIEIECDPFVWQRIETLIREQLPVQAARSGGAE
jgi:hypothetical protein